MLSEQFILDCREQIKRMRREIGFRKDLEEEARQLAEQKAAKKKASKKK